MATYAAETSGSFDLGKSHITEIGIICEHSVLTTRGILNEAHMCSSYRLSMVSGNCSLKSKAK